MSSVTPSVAWAPPGKNCGACGFKTCAAFSESVESGAKQNADCIFYNPNSVAAIESVAVAEPAAAPFTLQTAAYSGTDVTGMKYDFVITAFPNEPSARKIILPFRSDAVEKMNIVSGDLVLGRPAGAGCPIQHVVKVRDADPVTGLITGYVVSPAEARGNPNVKDVKMYHMIGFEGIAQVIGAAPEFGKRFSFLPGFCMMHRAHSGLVNFVVKTPDGIHVRAEGVIVL